MNRIVSQSSITESRSRSIDSSDFKIFHPPGFVPGDNDVLIGRGKKCWGHVGNKRLRRLVASKLEEYSAATTKKQKTKILLSVVSEVRTGTPRGRFIKKDACVGQWFEVCDFLAREKVSQAFRDALCKEYRSSKECKKKKKREKSDKEEGSGGMQPSKRSRSHLKPSAKEEGQPQVESANDNLSSSLTLSDLESSLWMGGISDHAFNLRSSLPDSFSLASWFEDESNRFQHIPSSEISPKGIDVYEPLPPLPEDFWEITNNDFIPSHEKKINEIGCQPLS